MGGHAQQLWQGRLCLRTLHGLGNDLIAAQTIQRTCLGIELNPAYVDVAIPALAGFYGPAGFTFGHRAGCPGQCSHCLAS